MTRRRHAPFYLALVAGLASAAGAAAIDPGLATFIGSTMFFAVYLGLALASLRTLTAGYLEKNAAASDVPVAVIFAVTLAAVGVAVGGLFVVLNRERQGAAELVLALSAVPLGWLTIHVMAAIHYAHLFWEPVRGGGKEARRSGLEFPGTDRPSGTDFLYFAIVIGMTAQTSDVQITTTQMRRINMLHAVASFFFNTVLVAAAVNAAVTLGN